MSTDESLKAEEDETLRDQQLADAGWWHCQWCDNDQDSLCVYANARKTTALARSIEHTFSAGDTSIESLGNRCADGVLYLSKKLYAVDFEVQAHTDSQFVLTDEATQTLEIAITMKKYTWQITERHYQTGLNYEKQIRLL